MNSHANPSRDPANDDSLLGMANEVLKKFLQAVDDMLPARVVSYDRETNRAQVIPLVQVVTTDGRLQARAQVASVPVFQYGGGGFVLSFPLQPGNLGWIKANDRDISLVLQSYLTNPPNTRRMHSFEDCVFIPDVMTGYDIAGEDGDRAVLQSLDGAVKVALGAASLKLAAPGCALTMGAGVIDMAAASVIINGVPFNTHKHTGVTVGGGTSGGPIA